MLRSMTIGLRVVVGLACCLLVWLATFGRGQDGSGGLDDLAIGTPSPDGVEVDESVYLVEVRSRPDYRLIEYEPATGRTTPIFTVPEFGVISSIALSPTGDQVALAYTRNYQQPGNGIYLIDLIENEGQLIDDDRVLDRVVAEQSKTFYDDLVYSPDGSTLWVSVKTDDELAVLAVDLTTGSTVQTIVDAVDPAVDDDQLVYLVVEPDESRRSIGVVDLATGATSTVDVLDRQFDLGNLLLRSDGEQVLLTALVPPDQPTIQIGEPAEAHGSHEGPAQWLTVDLDTGRARRLIEHEPLTVRDAVLVSSGELVISTADGLVFMSDPLTPVVSSRVITELAS